MNILTENEINIKSLEKEFYDYACRLAAKAFANYLQALDKELKELNAMLDKLVGANTFPMARKFIENMLKMS